MGSKGNQINGCVDGLQDASAILVMGSNLLYPADSIVRDRDVVEILDMSLDVPRDNQYADKYDGTYEKM